MNVADDSVGSGTTGTESAQPSCTSFAGGYTPATQNFGTYNQGFGTAPQNTVYINGAKSVQTKKPKARLSLGVTAAVILICMLFSGAAAFGGTVIANVLTSTSDNFRPQSPLASGSSSSPSVILKSYTNPNTEAGTYEQVAEAVSGTVVEITTESIVTDSYFWGGNYVTSGAGSGVIISADGLIITNNHVVSGANTITVRTKDGSEYTAAVLGTDADSDIAVIKVDAADLPFALLGDSDALGVGQEVLAVGNPLGNLGGTVTNGIISATSREVDIDGTSMTLIQTNAEVNPGNSGGGLFNLYGELIGIVNAKSTTASSGVSVEGIGFAIPINTASKVSTELINYGYVRGRVRIGINCEDIEDSWEAMMYRVSAIGTYVTASIHDDLKVGDRIVAVDGEEVTFKADIKAILKDRSVGDVVVVKVVRGGKYYDVSITLTEYVPSGAVEESNSSSGAFENNFGK